MFCIFDNIQQAPPHKHRFLTAGNAVRGADFPNFLLAIKILLSVSSEFQGNIQISLQSSCDFA